MSFLSVFLGILTFVLILVSLFLVMIVLMQKTKDGGMGAALGGGAAEAAFGADTGNVLSKSTIYAAITFFVLTFALYLGRIYERTHGRGGEGALPTITAPAAPVTTTPAPPTPGATGGVTLPTTTAPATAAPATPTPAPTGTPAAKTPGTEAPKK